MSRHPTGFTLIELLVVITIIVILIALFAPALDQAIYQAELVKCGAGQHAIVGGALLYTFDHNRKYPYRPGNREAEDTTSFAPFYLKSRTDNNPLNARDVRPIVKGYISSAHWPCPASGDFDASVEGTQDVDRVYGGYNLFFGFTYTKTPDWLGINGNLAAERGMLKTGDRWTFSTTDGDNNPVTHTFDLLTTDVDYNQNGRYSFGSHPDEQGTMSNRSSDGDLSGWPLDGTVTWTWWEKPGNAIWRGDIDMNAGREDGSVSRYTDVKPGKFQDPRFADIALFDTRFGYRGDWLNVPVQ